MKITDVNMRKVDYDGRVLAYVTLTFDESFVLHDVKIIKGDEGTFVAMPSRKCKDGQYRDIAHPITAEFRSYIEECVMSAYNADIPENS